MNLQKKQDKQLFERLYKPKIENIIYESIVKVNNFCEENLKDNTILSLSKYKPNLIIEEFDEILNNEIPLIVRNDEFFSKIQEEGKDKITKQIEICKKVGIHELIQSMPKGYDTILTENAANLSGGQKRLLSLAKTLLTDSKILLFDEVTSSLDIKTTNKIISILKELKDSHTVIIITHKKEVMKISDEIILLSKGRIVGKGAYKNLLKNNHFDKLVKN